MIPTILLVHHRFWSLHLTLVLKVKEEGQKSKDLQTRKMIFSFLLNLWWLLIISLIGIGIG
ncbi:transmembrane protein, putative [Medicago truncatula]|uniref:Transmembrane protein, putative n=1 Tax=Medicago truncatula TaxID=3880 RepID=A0A072VU11_MEDTR|nr:transmembrane protein, putative [Medicago truncatula]